jgi:hypothetical protein
VGYIERFNPHFAAGKWWQQEPFSGRIPYGGQGGAVIATEFMRSILEQEPTVLADDLVELCCRIATVGIDSIFTALVYRYNGTVGPYEGYFSRFWSIGGVPEGRPDGKDVGHMDKRLYNAPLSAEDRALLGRGYAFPISRSSPPPDPLQGVDCERLLLKQEATSEGDQGLDKSRWAREWWDSGPSRP